MSASITSDRANLRKRGTTLALATIIVLECYKHTTEDGLNTSKVDGIWRIIVGISLIPAFGTLYQRLTLSEFTRFIASKRQTHSEDGHELDEIDELKRKQREEEKSKSHSPDIDNLRVDGKVKEASSSPSPSEEEVVDEDKVDPEELARKKAHLGEFVKYCSEWRHLKLLLGTCVCWFLLDIALYGINLNQNVVLQQIGYDGSEGTPWNRLFRISTGGIIITALGFVPGYYASVLLIEKPGRKWIQIHLSCFAIISSPLVYATPSFPPFGTWVAWPCFVLAPPSTLDASGLPPPHRYPLFTPCFRYPFLSSFGTLLDLALSSRYRLRWALSFCLCFATTPRHSLLVVQRRTRRRA
ncbi:hypothetical protein BDQ17DRAFT_1547150 [Cyathus striatus]|nr:hypothetical protein BDQ17DRAFT_1547150 [Cyathus striatus]